MKHIICAIVLILFYIHGFNQQIEPQQQLTKQDYLKKSKNQKTAAWILIGGGAGAVTIAIISGLGKSVQDIGNILAFAPPKNSYEWENTVIVFGGVAMLGSIPLFISSGNIKRKANNMSLNLKFENSKFLPQNKFAGNIYPAISFKFKL
jgi:hypothetical protein